MLLFNVFLFVKMGFTSYCVEILIILTIVTGKYLWNKRRQNDFVEMLPGPKRHPIFGNALMFWCKDEDIFEKVVECIGSFPSPMRLFLGPKLCIVYSDATQVKKIFSSAVFAMKDDIYKFLKYFDGDALISGSGPKWKKDRRLMSPLFLKRNITQYFQIISNHAGILVNILEEKVDARTFNVEHYIHRACTDFVNESIIGLKTNAQAGELEEFITSISRAYELVFSRIVKPWLQIDFFYKFTGRYREQIAIRRIIHGFFWKVLRKAQENHSHLGRKSDTVRTALEQMLDIRDEVPDFATDEEIIHHLSTLYSASEDTVTTICSFALVLLGMYPQYQEKLAHEIFTVIGYENKIEEEHLGKLEYLEMVIKETLRLFPIAPFIMRQASQDIEIDGCRISKGMSVIISIHNIHRDPKQWTKPNDFYPEHFLPAAVESRHPYAYVPFSAGIRGCIGKPYAYMAMKILLVSILQKYSIEADGTLQEKPLTMDISVRFKDKNYPIRITRRTK